MKKIFFNNYKNIICIFVGILFLAIGTAFFKNSYFGSDAVSTLNLGLAKTLKLSYGTTNIIMNAVALIVLLIVAKNYLGIGTILVTFLLGVTINLIDQIGIVPSLKDFDKIWYIEYSVKLLYLLLANFICSFGVAIYIYANRGLTGFEGILMKIHTSTKIPFGVIKIINDIIFIIIGFLLGGTVGLGTIISSVIFGPLVDLNTKILKKTKILKEEQDDKKTKNKKNKKHN